MANTLRHSTICKEIHNDWWSTAHMSASLVAPPAAVRGDEPTAPLPAGLTETFAAAENVPEEFKSLCATI
ncbi:uncharacterized protein GLRG_09144 [Colletotrichum graminicola M1.001]|uniref:Uncharacterized protein n=1 Tax=Colletotrichum graminicola (strain M1.001 / M2 / FGSC 10212) TaxID=645133 RepID=E3QT12_COLGM|nr:uncharacterized protein GLRG_09144 [Colletotrichum graminicola M1.001]EFQ34000.1 hypothetical protein GLRG_09144 [Colletotrichum graminicola M1.001]